MINLAWAGREGRNIALHAEGFVVQPAVIVVLNRPDLNKAALPLLNSFQSLSQHS
jgi:hypothetical protein